MRSKELEKAVASYLTLKKYKYMRVDNYRCFRCGQVQNSKAKGWPDFFVYSPVVFAVECKTGSGRLTKEQEVVKADLESSGIKYIICRDNIDELLKV